MWPDWACGHVGVLACGPVGVWAYVGGAGDVPQWVLDRILFCFSCFFFLLFYLRILHKLRGGGRQSLPNENNLGSKWQHLLLPLLRQIEWNHGNLAGIQTNLQLWPDRFIRHKREREWVREEDSDWDRPHGQYCKWWCIIELLIFILNNNVWHSAFAVPFPLAVPDARLTQQGDLLLAQLSDCGVYRGDKEVVCSAPIQQQHTASETPAQKATPKAEPPTRVRERLLGQQVKMKLFSPTLRVWVSATRYWLTFDNKLAVWDTANS